MYKDTNWGEGGCGAHKIGHNDEHVSSFGLQKTLHTDIT